MMQKKKYGKPFIHPREKNTACMAHAMETWDAEWRVKKTDLCTTLLQRTMFLFDGRSKAYTAVSELNVYEGIAILKEGCRNIT